MYSLIKVMRIIFYLCIRKLNTLMCLASILSWFFDLKKENGNYIYQEKYNFSSFFFFWHIQKQIKALEEERESIVIEDENSLKDYFNLLEQHRSLYKEVRDIVLSPRHCLPFLQPGRLVSLECTSSDTDLPPIFIEDQLTWGLVINFERVKSFSEGENS